MRKCLGTGGGEGKVEVEGKGEGKGGGESPIQKQLKRCFLCHAQGRQAVQWRAVNITMPKNSRKLVTRGHKQAPPPLCFVPISAAKYVRVGQANCTHGRTLGSFCQFVNTDTHETKRTKYRSE